MSAHLRFARDRVVALDYATFYLYSRVDGAEEVNSLLVTAETERIAQGAGAVVVCSPAQYNFECRPQEFQKQLILAVNHQHCPDARISANASTASACRHQPKQWIKH